MTPARSATSRSGRGRRPVPRSSSFVFLSALVACSVSRAICLRASRSSTKRYVATPSATTARPVATFPRCPRGHPLRSTASAPASPRSRSFSLLPPSLAGTEILPECGAPCGRPAQSTYGTEDKRRLAIEKLERRPTSPGTDAPGICATLPPSATRPAARSKWKARPPTTPIHQPNAVNNTAGPSTSCASSSQRFASVASKIVAQRTAELGIRVALGATPADVLGLVLGTGEELYLVGLLTSRPRLRARPHAGLRDAPPVGVRSRNPDPGRTGHGR